MVAAAAFLTAAFAVQAGARVLSNRNSSSVVNATTCNGKEYVYEELAGYGFVVSDAVDKFGDNLGGLGSAIHVDQASWEKSHNGTYTGVLWALPDRGWNTQGTLNYQPRVHKFRITFTPAPNATAENPAVPNLVFEYQDTIRFSGPDGTPCTGLDADATGFITYPGFPEMPVATYTGDGFGGEGPGGKRIPVDSEGLFINKDGSFWVSDEYGPFVYLFDSKGKMLTAIRPPDAIIPMRNGSQSFSAASPPHYIDNGEGPLPVPEDPDTGRDNNSGFEGMHVSDDGRVLWVMLQSAAVQEGGLKGKYRKYTRLLRYDVSNPLAPVYAAEYVVPLPLYPDPEEDPADNLRVAKQSEIHALANGQFLVLARDSGAGHGQARSRSVYRHVDVFDVSAATDIRGAAHDCATCAVASTKAVLASGVEPARLCPWLDFNADAQLARFGLHNGGAQDAALLNEKWESIALVPVEPGRGKTGKCGRKVVPAQEDGEEFFLISLSDNDFITQHGFLNGGAFAYADSSGYNLDNQALVFRVRIPN